MRRFKKWRIGAALLCLCVVLWSCSEDDSPPPDGNGNPDLGGMTRVTGTVRDAAGAAISNVFLHVIYEFPASALGAAYPMIPSSCTFYNGDQTLFTSCDGTTPLAEGVMLKIFWDRDGDGPDDEDTPPPLCDDPPDCVSGPSQTVNVIEFPINGVDGDIGPGLFYMMRALYTVGDMLVPNRYYVRVFCTDGNVLYTSQVVDVPPGPSERELDFICTPCDGAPEVPVWRLDQSYPNPATDSVTIAFGLQETARTTITLRWPDGQTTETLTDEVLSSGGHRLRVALGDRPNGLYTVRCVGGTFQRQHTLLKNVGDYETLRATDEFALTNEQGEFTFDAAAGTEIERRDEAGQIQASASLSRMKVVAIKLGYQIADTTFDVAAGETHSLSLTLRPQ